MPKPNLTGFDPYSSGSGDSNPSSQQPSNPSVTTTPSALSSLNQGQIQFFLNQGYTVGLLKTLLREKEKYAQRCWIIDNGSRMLVKDSHKVSVDQTNGDIHKLDGLTRWDELMDCVGNQVWVASNVKMSMRFALLNPTSGTAPQYFTMDENNINQQHEIQIVRQIMTSIQPSGPTNLSKELHVIRNYVASISQQLRSSNKKVSIVIATQGLPTNDNGECNAQITQEFIEAFKSFYKLPVVISIRLCTDDEVVFHFYNDILDHLEDKIHDEHAIPYDVIDDYFGESLEIYLKNPWITYGLALHRFRELGLHVHVLDLLDERLLTLEELRNFCFILFDIEENMKSSLPHPAIHWEQFLSTISSLMAKERQQWNPVTRKFCPWINILQLRQLYGKNASVAQTQSNANIPNPFQQHPGTQTHPPQENTSNKQQSTQQQSPPTSTSTPTAPPSQVKPPAQAQMNPPPVDNESIKKNLLVSWALIPPAYQSLKQLPELLGSLHFALPPAFGLEEHKYFQKWKALSNETLLTGGKAVIKRAHRKAKFLLHPDKLPRDLTEKQTHVCKLIWDILADAWEVYDKE